MNAQPKSINEVSTQDKIVNYSLDRDGNIYVSLENGIITKYSANLDSLLSFSPTKTNPIDLLESWHGLKIFGFYQQFQEYIILDRFLSRELRYSLRFTAVNFVDIATIASDENLWLIDQGDFRLIKYNTILREPETVVPLDFIMDPRNQSITFMQEYQNLLFVVDILSGIYIFDNFGNYLNKVAVEGIERCSFYENYLVYLNRHTLTIRGLYDDFVKEVPLAEEEPIIGVLSAKTHFFILSTNSIQKVAISLH